ncbi:MAG: LapA family protein [Syntrophomonas sp.]|nr:LapA family protein [Syntrophomonas sp.]
MNAYLLGALFFVLTIAVFVLQNTTQVTVQFIYWTSSPISLAVVVIISACIGSLITFLLDSYRAFKTGQKMRGLINQNRKYEKEIETLKTSKSINEVKEGV